MEGHALGTPIKEIVVIEPDEVEGIAIVRAGMAARKEGVPEFLNPYRDPSRRKLWERGWNK